MVEQAEATRWRVLLVDGDGDVREQLRSAWVRGPLDLHHADDIATAARLHQAVPFDALLLDTDQMSGPGLSWCRSLRRVLEDDPAHPRFIQTVWGVGYVFIPDGAPGPASTGTPPEPR